MLEIVDGQKIPVFQPPSLPKMRRKALLAVSGCAEKRFESLAARNQLPFPSPLGKWNEYTLEDAFRLRLMLAAADGASVDLVEARRLAMQFMAHGLLEGDAARGTIWAAVACISEPDGVISRFCVADYKTGIDRRVLDLASRKCGDLISLTMVNASKVALDVLSAAERLSVWQ